MIGCVSENVNVPSGENCVNGSVATELATEQQGMTNYFWQSSTIPLGESVWSNNRLTFGLNPSSSRKTALSPTIVSSSKICRND